MKRKQSLVRDTLVAARRFLTANAAALGPVTTSGASKELDDAIAAFAGHAVAQDEHFIGSTGETEKQRSLRRDLRSRYLRPIAKVAAAKLGDVPEIGTLRLPPVGMKGLVLVDRANAIANAATPYVGTITAAGFAPDFLDALRALTTQLQDSLGGRTDHVAKRRGSTIALGTETANGRRVLKLLDAVIEQQVPADSQLLAEWRAVRRIPSKPGPARGSGAASTAGSAAPAAPAPSTPATSDTTLTAA